MSCYTLFGVFHGHRPAVYINQHLLWALISLLQLTLSSGSSRIASPAFFYFFAICQLPSAKCDVRCDAIARVRIKKVSASRTRALVGLARGQGTTQGQGTRQGHRTTQGQGTTRGQRTKQGQGTSQQGKTNLEIQKCSSTRRNGSYYRARKIMYDRSQNRVRGLSKSCTWFIFSTPPLTFFHHQIAQI